MQWNSNKKKKNDQQLYSNNVNGRSQTENSIYLIILFT